MYEIIYLFIAVCNVNTMCTYISNAVYIQHTYQAMYVCIQYTYLAVYVCIYLAVYVCIYLAVYVCIPIYTGFVYFFSPWTL